MAAMKEAALGSSSVGPLVPPADGTRSYALRRMIRGRNYIVDLGAHDPVTAGVKLRRFEEDPEGFDPRGEVRREALLLTQELAQEYIDWCAAAAPGKKLPRNSKA